MTASRNLPIGSDQDVTFNKIEISMCDNVEAIRMKNKRFLISSAEHGTFDTNGSYVSAFLAHN